MTWVFEAEDSVVAKIGMFCLTVAVATAEVTVVAKSEQRPNVIYVLADDLGYGDLSCYGQRKIETPNIDRLSEEGIRFVNYYSGSTVCSPSRAVLMTGQHTGRVYLRGNLKGELGAELDPKMRVLPELFKEAGYVTGAFGKWGLGQTNTDDAQNPLVHGFDQFFGWKSQTLAHTYYPSTLVENGKEIELEEGTYAHDLVMEKAFAFIAESARSDRPFFCYIPTAVPHAAMHAPAELHEKWRSRFPQFEELIGEYDALDEYCPDVQNPIAAYAAMIENLDNQIGKILDLLNSLSLDEKTLIVFTSDNGPHREGGHDPIFWNSNGELRGFKRDLYEGGIRSPMLARWPGVISAGSETTHISASWDVLLTMAELLGLKVPEQSNGVSFMPTLEGKAGEQKLHSYLYWEFCIGPAQELVSQAVRVGEWKAVVEKGKSLELYNLREDPGETMDQSERHPEIVTRIEAMMSDARIPLTAESRKREL